MTHAFGTASLIDATSTITSLLRQQASTALARVSDVIQTSDAVEASRLLQSQYSSNRLSVDAGEVNFDMQLHKLALGKLELASLRFGAPVTLEQSPTEFLLVSTQIDGRANIRSHQSSQDGGTGLVMIDSQSAPIQKHFSSDSWRLHLRVPLPTITAKCAELDGHGLNEPLVFQSTLDTGSHAQTRWLSLLNMLVTYLAAPGELRNPFLIESMQEMVLLLMLTELPHNYQERWARGGHDISPRHVKRAEAYMHEYAGDALTLGAIAQVAGVSIRALSEGFQRSLRTSPMQYLRELRLQGARRELLEAGEYARVADVAERWGFTHLGRFGAAYRERFDELPSQTLRRT
ncbi:AraC-like ligand-binding domain-containing protein [Pseudomonas helleri]|uniref:Helix-turn-helix domain-containing protein n=1 Tax=Pseudomonas helleri TaxID=1608996 RepID=A0A7X1WUA1_9PSED|nr:helix-turn-helix domain-containing protein [Pseudomonas helleri]MQT74850.1 helix-turn-helix domain-containing protein [Pseudomonas helleri]